MSKSSAKAMKDNDNFNYLLRYVSFGKTSWDLQKCRKGRQRSNSIKEDFGLLRSCKSSFFSDLMNSDCESELLGLISRERIFYRLYFWLEVDLNVLWRSVILFFSDLRYFHIVRVWTVWRKILSFKTLF